MREFLFCFLILLLSSCSGDEDLSSSVDYNYEYLPLMEGTEAVFKMDSVVFNIDQTGQSRDSTSFYLKEVQEEWIDLSGRELMAVDQYKSDSLNGPWTFYRRVFDAREVSSYKRIASNLEIVLFPFPPSLGKSWDAVSLINTSVGIPIGRNYVDIFRNWDEAYLINFLDSMLLDGLYIDSVYHVELVDRESLVDIRFEEHFYAKNIGLVQRNVRMLDTQDPEVIIPFFEDYAEAGYILKQSRQE